MSAPDLGRFIAGFRRFQKSWFCRDHNLFENLVEEQSPKALVIACSDSRVDPALLLDCNPGDLFVVRNVANLVPPYEAHTTTQHGVSAALEFAVRSLKVEPRPRRSGCRKAARTVRSRNCTAPASRNPSWSRWKT